MSQCDHIFINMCRDILENGTDTRGEKVRPHWPDGTPAYTIKQFGICNRYDLRKEFPGSIGKAYGYQMGVKHVYKEGLFDQTDRVLYDLRHNPFSRRILTNLYVHQDLHEMNLYPCAYSMTFNVTQERGDGKLVLNAVLNQRSNDVLTANNWNVAQYALLLMMIAQVSDMVPGVLVHMIADAHIYDRHVPLIQELISREPYPAPKVWLNPEVRDFYQFTTDDLHVENYQYHEQIRNIPVAI